MELIEQYPNEPVSLDAMRWLLQYWTGAELTYHRLRAGTPQKGHLEFNHASVGEAIQKAFDLAGTDPASREPTDTVDTPNPSRFVTHAGRIKIDATQDWLDIELKNQREHALRMAQLIRRTSPTLFQSPEVQLSLASLLRQCNLTTLPDERPVRPQPGWKKETLAVNATARLDLPTQKVVNCANTSACAAARRLAVGRMLAKGDRNSPHAGNQRPAGRRPARVCAAGSR